MNGKAGWLYGVLAPAVLALGLAGCGGGSGSSDRDRGDVDDDDDEPAREMTIEVPYPVSANDRLVVTSPEPAEIRVSHSFEPDLRTVTLLSGSAELLRGDFDRVETGQE